MGYKELLEIAKLMTETVRLIAFARFYKTQKIDGLHYIHQVDGSNAIAISRPDQTTHHEATSFLMSQIWDKKSQIKTVEGHARNLKKFLDFLMFWKLEDEIESIHLIPVKSGGTFPLEVILLSFADYLRCIPNGYKPFSEIRGSSHSIQWSMLKFIPLNNHAMAEGKLMPVVRSALNELKKADWSEYPPGALGPIIYTACAYLEFLRDRTKRYENLPIEQIPRKEVRENYSLISGTAGSRVRIIFDVDNIARDSVTDGPSGGNSRLGTPLHRSEVINEADANSFIALLDPYEDAQDLLLFSILRYFGLRPGEASYIQIEPSTIPANLDMYHSAREGLTKSLLGKIKYIQEGGLHGNWVIDTGWKTKASQREVPLINHKAVDPYSGEKIQFPTQDEFTDLLYWALVQRRDLMSQYSGKDHGYLFVSASNNSRGKPLSEKGVYSKFNNLANKLFIHSQGLVDARSFYPHTFRHLFATSLSLRYRRPIGEISKWLGHSSVTITQNTYIHWIPEPNTDSEKGEVSHMGKFYKQQAEISERAFMSTEEET
ncbi:site-specific integrase [Paenibacillus frigoriresistens]|uniref:tyrosine-type recombinase/integrase n=1 Tax=Paenibacillus alginolyticus TaxID=59839 RepID=UPI0015669065|nr:site-specific integrase [Paenibacillus frigoriresistens]NRF94846.1 site-specific integrase [Paenibacillus frigoriresistens]